ncbi:RNA polymerase I-specific transcription initiation factor Rrn10p [Monosporozyma servazzii]
MSGDRIKDLDKYTIFDSCNGTIKDSGKHVVSADELLSHKVNHELPIPFKTLADLDQIAERDREDGLYRGELMPQMDLKVLHYFLTQLCLQRYPHLVNSFDETSLITLGLLVDQWVEEYLLSFQSQETSTDEEISGSESESESESESDTDHEEDEEESKQEDKDSKRRRVDDDDTDPFKQIIGKGPAQSLAKFTNYRDYPADI